MSATTNAAGPRKWLNTAIGVLLLSIMLFPVYWMVNAALQPNTTVLETTLFPLHPRFDAFAAVWSTQAPNLRTSLIIALGTTLLCLLVATPAAYGLSRRGVPGASTYLFGVLLTQMIPAIVIANGLYAGFIRFGLLNTHVGLILADSTAAVPFAILVIRAFMVAIPHELVEAARLDGAGRLRAFVSIIVPVSRNAIITAGVFAFLAGWNDFLFAVTLTSNTNIRPVTLGIYEYLGTNVNEWALVMATAALASIPAIVLLVMAQRFIAAGTNTTGLK